MINQIQLFQGGRSGSALYNNIVPNIPDAYYKVKKHTTVFGLLIAVCFVILVFSVVMFIVTGERTVKQGWQSHYDAFGPSIGNTDLHPNFAFLPGIILGAVGLITFIVLTSTCGARASKLKTLKELVFEIGAQEKASLDFLSIRQGFVPLSKAAVIRIINRLIETGNLQDYEVIGEVGVARTSFHAHPSDFNVIDTGKSVGFGARVGAAISAFTNPAAAKAQQAPQQPPQPRQTHCVGCGSAIKKGSGRFCEFCGTRLD